MENKEFFAALQLLEKEKGIPQEYMLEKKFLDRYSILSCPSYCLTSLEELITPVRHGNGVAVGSNIFFSTGEKYLYSLYYTFSYINTIWI